MYVIGISAYYHDSSVCLFKNGELVFACEEEKFTGVKHDYRFPTNALKYISNNANDGLAVFSEMYYADGWNAYLDGVKEPHFRTDYVLRAIQIPPGKHTIEFKFEPEIVKTGSTIALASSLGIVLMIVGGLYYERRKLWFNKKE